MMYTLLLGTILLNQLAPQEPLVWPPPPETPRIQMIGILARTTDLGESWLRRLVRVLTGQKEPWMFFQPYGICVDDSGNIYVADQGLRSVVILNLEKKTRRVLHTSGRGYNLQWPQDVAVWEKGNLLFVAEPEQRAVLGFDRTTLKLKLRYAFEEWIRPVSLAIDPERDILYVSDSKGHAIYLVDLEREGLIDKWGERGSEPGQFNFPTHITVDREGRLYVVDMGNFRIQVFDPSGELLSFFGEPGDRPGAFARPRGIAVDSEGHIYVCDAMFAGFQIYDIYGRLYLFVGGVGTDFCQFSMPGDIAIDQQDRIYVTDPFNHRIQIFQYLKEPED